MLVLAIDTATPAVTAGVVRLTEAGAESLSSAVTVDARAHAEALAPGIRSALADAGLAAADIDAVVVGLGPGPFTGLRVGIVTAGAFADARCIPAYGVCSLDAIARQDLGSPQLVATDARRHEIYFAGYDAAAVRLVGPEVGRPEIARELLPSLNMQRANGAGALMYADVLGLPVGPAEYPSPVGLVLAVAANLRAPSTPAPLTPLYLRRPDVTLPARVKLATQA